MEAEHLLTERERVTMQAADIIEHSLQRADSGMYDRILAIEGGPELDKAELVAAAQSMRTLLQLKEAGNRC